MTNQIIQELELVKEWCEEQQYICNCSETSEGYLRSTSFEDVADYLADKIYKLKMTQENPILTETEFLRWQVEKNIEAAIQHNKNYEEDNG